MVVTESEWDISPRLDTSLFQYIVSIAPYFWIFIIGIFIIITFFIFTKTRYGYRRARFNIFLAIILLGTILGASGYLSGFTGKTEKGVTDFFGINSFDDNLKNIWMNPDSGLISGSITSLGDDDMVIMDFSGNPWNVEIWGTDWNPKVKKQVGEEIEIIGQNEGGTFVADEIRPWRLGERK